MKIVPLGHISYISNFKTTNYFIKKITPSERIESLPSGNKKIISDPVYFSLFTPRRFDEAKVALKFKVEGVENFMPIIELGALNDKNIWRYDLRPLDNEIINKLSGGWNKLESGDKILLQREASSTKKYYSIDEFMNNPPDSDQIALYNSDLKRDFKILGYKASKIQTNKIEFPIRGDFQFYTYIKGEDLDFYFKFSDINQNKDRDPVGINLYYKNTLIDSRSISDDGANIEAGGKTETKQIRFTVPGLPEGDYKLEVKVNDDIITNEMLSPQTKIVFINKVRLSINADDARLYTNSQKIQLLTTNPGSLQKVKISGNELNIDKTYEQFVWLNNSPLADLELKKGDITISGNGLFSFRKDQFFNPIIKKLDSTFNIDQTGINYILASYKLPIKQGEWLTAEAKFDLTRAYRENGNYNFLISASGLENNIGNKNGIILESIKIDLKGADIFSYLKKFFKIDDQIF
jgi:hypothetical protein